MAGDFCPVCGRYRFSFEPHVCPPAWEVLVAEHVVAGRPDWDEAERVYATDAEEALEAWAARFDSECGDYPLAHGHDEDVLVRQLGKGGAVRYNVRGSLEPTYRAERCE